MARPPSPHPTHPPPKSLKQTRLRLSGPLRPLRARPKSMTEDTSKPLLGPRSWVCRITPPTPPPSPPTSPAARRPGGSRSRWPPRPPRCWTGSSR
eukprot:11467763-Alexandrium_andersonii.AAC.1